MSTKYKMIYRTVVTGLSHHNYALHAKEIEVGDELEMKRDLGNTFDSNAVALHHEHRIFGAEQIGWLQKVGNNSGQHVIAKLLDAGVDLKCVVISHDKNISRLDERMYVGVMIGVDE